jgi:hypothetical protein
VPDPVIELVYDIFICHLPATTHIFNGEASPTPILLEGGVEVNAAIGLNPILIAAVVKNYFSIRHMEAPGVEPGSLSIAIADSFTSLGDLSIHQSM